MQNGVPPAQDFIILGIIPVFCFKRIARAASYGSSQPETGD